MQKRIFIKCTGGTKQGIDIISDTYQALPVQDLVQLVETKIIDGIFYSSSEDLTEIISLAINNPLTLAAAHLQEQIDLLPTSELRQRLKKIVIDLSNIISLYDQSKARH